MAKKDDQFFLMIYQIIKSGHWITDQVTRVLKEYDISEPQFNVLRILKGQKGNPISVQEIQSKMIQKSSNVTRIVDKLKRKELVARSECEHNRRKMDITITKEGIDYLEILSQKVSDFHKPYKNNLTEEEVIQVIQLIKKLKIT